MSDAESPRGATATDKNPLSFGCELEFLVGYVLEGEPDPDEGNKDLAPILTISRREDSKVAIHRHIQDTLKRHGFIIQDDLKNAQDKFGILVEGDVTVGEPDASGTGYHFQECELNSTASWTSTIAFQELHMVISILLHHYRIRVNRTCGVHIHVGNGLKPLNTQTVKRVGALLWCIDPFEAQIHPPGRRTEGFSMSIRDLSVLALQRKDLEVFKHGRIGKHGRLGKPGFGGSPPMASCAPARNRQYASSRLLTSRLPMSEHWELERQLPGGQNLPPNYEYPPFSDIPTIENEASTLDGVWRLLACERADEVAKQLDTLNTGKPNYHFQAYWDDREDMNPDQDEWLVDTEKKKFTIEFRQAAGSMDADWICAWGRICAAIILFARNASTDDFFSMVMRLAQAHGDFGEPGLAPYDFIDFLGDIGCFAEAELLETKLQEKELFWFPCRNLEAHVVHNTSPRPEDDSWATAGWALADDSGVDLEYQPDAEPARPQSNRAPRWPGEPGYGVESASNVPQVQQDTAEPPKGQEPEEQSPNPLSGNESSPVEHEDLPLTASEDDEPVEATSPVEVDDSDSLFNGSVGSLYESDEETDKPAPVQDGEKPKVIGDDEPEPGQPDLGTDQTEPDTEKPGNTDAHDVEWPVPTGQQTQTVGADTEDKAQMAKRFFRESFPHGWEKVWVSNEDDRCGPRAVAKSFEEQVPLLKAPTFEGLVEILNFKVDELKVATGVEHEAELGVEKQNYTEDQLAGALREWGRQKCQPSLKLGLGVMKAQPESDALSLALVMVEEGDDRVIWIHNDGNQYETYQIKHEDGTIETLPMLGHWSGLKPRRDPEALVKENVNELQKALIESLGLPKNEQPEEEAEEGL